MYFLTKFKYILTVINQKHTTDNKNKAIVFLKTNLKLLFQTKKK